MRSEESFSRSGELATGGPSFLSEVAQKLQRQSSIWLDRGSI